MPTAPISLLLFTRKSATVSERVGGLPPAGLAAKELAAEVAEQGSGLALDLGGLDCGDGSITGLGRGQFLRRAEGEVYSVQPALDADEEGLGFVGRDLEAERRQAVVEDDERTPPVPGLGELPVHGPFIEVCEDAHGSASRGCSLECRRVLR